MTYKIVTREARTFNAEDIVDDVSNGYQGAYVYYVFMGKHNQYDLTSDVPTRPQDSESYKRSVYDNMLFGKRVTPADAKVMISRYDYVSNTTYDKYDDTDADLYNKRFFVTVARENERDVFKCLDNYKGSRSVVPPDKTDISNFDEIYRTSDGYVWKYMYTIPYADMEKFATRAHVPVVPNTAVSDSANNGSIDVVVVESAGAGYRNYLYGSLGKNDLNIGGNSKRIDVSGNNRSSTTDDFYIGCIFKIVSGDGVGEFSRIQSYDVYNDMRVITLENILTVNTNSEYEITPEVRVIGDYTQSVNAIARAVINSTANNVDYVEILNKGLDYKAVTAYVYSSNVVPVTANSIVRPIIGPFGGHGYDANNELGASHVCFSVTFNESVDSLPAVNDFRQVGIVSNPRFSNVIVNFSEKDGTTFINGETAYQIDPLRIYATGVGINTTSNAVIAAAASFNQIEANTIVYIVGSSARQLATVTSITNSTHIRLDTTGNFACNDCEIYLANVSSPTIVVNDIALGVAVSNAFAPYDTSSRLVGYDSGASGVISNMEINNKATTLSNYTQMWRYNISTTGSFDEDEIVYQPNSAANSHGSLFGIVEDGSNTVMYLTNQTGYINTGDNVIGLTSEDFAYVSTSQEPDLIYNSGRIIYLENIEKVARDSSQKETFKIIFSY